MLNNWLAGLIEGDGSIITPNTLRSEENKLQYPYIRIAFHEKDLQLANNLTEWLGYGKSNEVRASKLVVWTVYEEKAIKDLIKRINGKMRTPKVHRLEKLIDWYNTRDPSAEKLRCEGLDSTPLGSSAWLAGMSDADSNFNIILTKGSNGTCRIQTHWSIEYAQKTYHGYDQLYWGSCISSYLDTTLYSRSREREGKLYSSFTVMAHSDKSNRTIIEYFNRYPLLSSKYLDYKDWERVVDMKRIKKGTLEYTDMLKEVEKLKAGMNNKRRVSNWEHLNWITNQSWLNL
jgi:hypothetical protein